MQFTRHMGTDRPDSDPPQDPDVVARMCAFGEAFKSADQEFWAEFNEWDCALADGFQNR